MGSPANSSSLQTTWEMKSVAVAALCLFAAVAAEADAKPVAEADAYYGAYGYGLHPYAHHGYGHGLAHHGYYGYPYAYHGYHYGKRSADAEASADAYYGAYGYAHHGYGLPYAHGYGYAHHGYYGYPYAYGYYGHH